MNVMRNSFLLLFALLAVAAPAHGQQVFTRFATNVPNVDGWNYEPQARFEASDNSACWQGRSPDCSANCPTGPAGSNVYLWATDFADFAQQACPAITKVKISVRTGFGADNSSTAAGDIQVRVRGPFAEVALPVLRISGNQSWRGPDDGGWDITNLLGRAWTAADVNALQVGIQRDSRSAPATFLWVDGYRVQVEVPVPPTLILTSPASQQIPVGQTAVLTTTASGTAPNFRWALQDPSFGNGWRPLADGPYSVGGTTLFTVQGATAPQMLVTPLSPTPTSFVFQNSAANPCSLVVSQTTTVSTCYPASIALASPATQQVPVGQTAVLTTTSAGSAPINYRWALQDPSYSNGWRPLADGPYSVGGTTLFTVQGAASPQLLVTPLSPTPTSFVFQNSAANPCSLVVSQATTVSTCYPVSVSIGGPTSRQTPTGQTTILSANTSGSAPLTVRWRARFSSSAPWTMLSDGVSTMNALFVGTGTPSLQVTLLSDYARLEFQCVVSNPCSSATSPLSSLTSCTSFARVPLVGQSERIVVAGSPTIISPSPDASLINDASAQFSWETEDPSYPGTGWRPLADGTSVMIRGQPFLLAGTSSRSLTVSHVGNAPSTASFRLRASRINDSSNCEGWYSSTATIVSCVQPAGLSVSPMDQMACPDSTVTISATETLPDPVTYQWLLELPSYSNHYVLLTDGLFADPQSTLSFVCSGSRTPTLMTSSFRRGRGVGPLRFKVIANGATGASTSCAAYVRLDRTCFTGGMIDLANGSGPPPFRSTPGVVGPRGGQGSGSTSGGLASLAVMLRSDDSGTQIEISGDARHSGSALTGMATITPVTFELQQPIAYRIQRYGTSTFIPIQLQPITGAIRGQTGNNDDGMLFPGTYSLSSTVTASSSNSGSDWVDDLIRLEPSPSCGPADVTGGGNSGLVPDGTIDAADFIAFINSFGIGDRDVDATADVAGGGFDAREPDGVIDGSDFIAFINSFASGCD